MTEHLLKGAWLTSCDLSLGHIARCGLLLQMEYCGRSVCHDQSPAKVVESIEMFVMWTQVGPGSHLLDGDAHWRHLANTTEPSMCGGHAALFMVALWNRETIYIFILFLLSSSSSSSSSFFFLA